MVLRKLPIPLFPLKDKAARATAPDTAASNNPNKHFTTVTAVLLAIFIGGSLWIAISGLIEKVHLSRALQQVIEIDSGAHDASLAGRIDENRAEDLIALLGRLGSIVPTGEVNGTKIISNPWNGMVAAFTVPGVKRFRLETLAPANRCRRLIDLYNHNAAMLGLEQIEVKDSTGNWQSVYAENHPGAPTEVRIAAACNNPVQVDMILTFSLK